MELRREGIAREVIDDRATIDEMVLRLLRRLDGQALDLLLNDTCFQEIRRLRRSKDPEKQAYLSSLRRVQASLPDADQQTLQTLCADVVRVYAEEIHGHFDPGLYAKATHVLPKGLALLLRKQRLWPALVRSLSGELSLSDTVRSAGHIATFDRLVERGTCVLVPTHLSNLDSLVVGLCLHNLRLPPMIYGAGINLFVNWLLSYFMNHLGAYKVDREKKHLLYKEVLKEYATMALEKRWHSLFFPGGTRIRSGEVESSLKKGLLGTGLEAYRRNLLSGHSKPRVFFVPATINYTLVLEAATLIDDHLKEAGKARYIITDDEFSAPERVLQFLRSAMELNDPIEVYFGQPLDPFGNPVNEDGDSLDPGGRPFDPRGYLFRDDRIVADEQRDRVYTRRLARAVSRSFRRDTLLYSTHVVAFVAQGMCEAAHPGLDLYRRLLLAEPQRRFSKSETLLQLEALLLQLRGLASEGQVRLSPVLHEEGAEGVLSAACKHFSRYHLTQAVSDEGGGVYLADPRLALYYANRLKGLSVGQEAAEGQR